MSEEDDAVFVDAADLIQAEADLEAERELADDLAAELAQVKKLLGDWPNTVAEVDAVLARYREARR